MKDRNWGGARRGSGRPLLPKDEVKKIRTVKMSDKEWHRLGELAEKDGKTKSEYIRLMVFGADSNELE